jgi:hypothetical protein
MASENAIEENLQKVTSASAAGSKKYKIAEIGKGMYNAKKCGRVWMNALLGCFAEYYEYEIDLGCKEEIFVRYTSVCNGWLAGIHRSSPNGGGD